MFNLFFTVCTSDFSSLHLIQSQAATVEDATAVSEQSQQKEVVKEEEGDVVVNRVDGGEVEGRGGVEGGVGGVEKVEKEDASGSEGESDVSGAVEGAVKVKEVEAEKLQKEAKEEGEVGREKEGGEEKVEKGEVEKVVEEVRGEVERVQKEVREEKVREAQEVQMADENLNWLRDSAQVRMGPHN